MGFEPTIPGSERLHTYALDPVATEIGINNNNKFVDGLVKELSASQSSW
jgi:hypothetical protein